MELELIHMSGLIWAADSSGRRNTYYKRKRLAGYM